MLLNTQTRKCPICGEPYNVHPATTANQSACPQCVAKANKKEGRWKTNPASDWEK